jgi:hypothetical protein
MQQERQNARVETGENRTLYDVRSRHRFYLSRAVSLRAIRDKYVQRGGHRSACQTIRGSGDSRRVRVLDICDYRGAELAECEVEMKLNKKDRGFYILSESWYAEANYPILRQIHKGYVDDIHFGIYPENGNGGTEGEMTMVWKRIGEKNTLTAQLQCYDDAFTVLFSFSDVIEKLNNLGGKDLTIRKFTEILKSCGFQDLTRREQ